MSVDNWKELLLKLSNCKSLTELDIDYCTSFSHMLWSFPIEGEPGMNIISQGAIGGNVLAPLTQAINNSSIPTAVINREYAPSSTPISAAGEFLVKSFANLQSLSVRSNHFNEREARLFAELLLRNRTIRYLNLWDNNIADDGAMAIGESLRYNYTLLYLSVGKNSIGSLGCEYLSSSVGHFKLTPSQVIILFLGNLFTKYNRLLRGRRSSGI